MPESELKHVPPLETGASANRETRGSADSKNSTTISNLLLDAALRWLGRGVPVLPLQPKSKYLVKGFGPRMRVITEPGEARAWFGERSCNLGLCTGGPAGLAVLDFDNLGTYAAWCKLSGRMFESYTEITARGRHVFFYTDGDLPSAHCCGLFELKASGAVVMSAPSVHPSGFSYHPLDPCATILMVLPSFLLLSELSKKNPAKVARVQAPVAGRDDLVGRIKAAWPILDLAQSMTKLTSRDGRWFHGLCPLHSERVASFWLDSERGVFGCYSCHVRGDVINLFALHYKLTIADAIRIMACRLRPGVGHEAI